MVTHKPRVIYPAPPKRGALIAHCCSIIILLLLVLLYPLYYFDPRDFIYPVCIAILGLFVWALWSWNHVARSAFDPYILFFVAAVLFNGGQALLEVFGLNSYGILKNTFSSATTLDTLVLVLLCLALFHFGGLFSAMSGSDRGASHVSDAPASLLRDVRIAGWIFISISFFPALYVMKDAVSVVLSAGYAALYQQDNGTSFGAAPRILADFLVPGALFLVAG